MQRKCVVTGWIHVVWALAARSRESEGKRNGRRSCCCPSARTDWLATAAERTVPSKISRHHHIDSCPSPFWTTSCEIGITTALIMPPDDRESTVIIELVYQMSLYISRTLTYSSPRTHRTSTAVHSISRYKWTNIYNRCVVSNT